MGPELISLNLGIVVNVVFEQILDLITELNTD